MNANRNLRIVFMGTPEFAVTSLKAVLSAGFDVVAVVTAPDRPAGRGRKLKASAVKEFAIHKNLPVLQPISLKDPEFLEQLESFKANLQIVVAFRMLPKAVWAMPAFGTFNLHASLLPAYRGAAPINWAIINGEKETGVTTFFIDEEIDTGQIIYQEKTAIGINETVGELHDRLMDLGGQLVVKTVSELSKGPVKTHSQKQAESLKPAPKLNRENCRIDWETSAREIFNLIRGLNPYPAAWTELHHREEVQRVKLFQVRVTDIPSSKSPGSIEIENRQMLAHCSDNILEIQELQLEGKSKMPVRDVLNGLHLNNDLKFV
jgi:methionyl-tRNA formyltransferase